MLELGFGAPWLLLLVLLLLWVNKMEITCISVPGGWQTMVYLFNDKKAYPFGPVFNKVTDLWGWQRANLFDVVDGYKLMKVA